MQSFPGFVGKGGDALAAVALRHLARWALTTSRPSSGDLAQRLAAERRSSEDSSYRAEVLAELAPRFNVAPDTPDASRLHHALGCNYRRVQAAGLRQAVTALRTLGTELEELTGAELAQQLFGLAAVTAPVRR